MYFHTFSIGWRPASREKRARCEPAESTCSLRTVRRLPSCQEAKLCVSPTHQRLNQHRATLCFSVTECRWAVMLLSGGHRTHTLILSPLQDSHTTAMCTARHVTTWIPLKDLKNYTLTKSHMYFFFCFCVIACVLFFCVRGPVSEKAEVTCLRADCEGLTNKWLII